MKTGLNHLPAVKTRALEILLHEAFEDALQSQRRRQRSAC